MGRRFQISVTVDKDIIEKIDYILSKQPYGCNRSAFVEKAIKKELGIQ